MIATVAGNDMCVCSVIAGLATELGRTVAAPRMLTMRRRAAKEQRR